MGADGAMVPLVGGEWGEVKLLSLGEPLPGGASAEASAETPGETPGETAPKVGRLSYFARLSSAEVFTTQAWGELHRRGVDGATAVAAIQDGAPWLQGFVDLHRPDAVRILDWPHAAEHLRALAEAVFGRETLRARQAAQRLRAWLWREGPQRVLGVAAAWARAQPQQPDVAREQAYFQERAAQLAYPVFRAAGWPVGSGATESGHKQVMQARMKRAGMRWTRAHVNPVLALTTLTANDRWASEGPHLLAEHRRAGLAARRARQAARRSRHAQTSPAPPGPLVTRPSTPPTPTPPQLAPPPTHPWRRYGASLSAKI
jgi:hypothetical protein